MTVWADYAYPGADLTKYAGVMRYLPFTGSRRTDLTASEIKAHLAAGRAVSPVWEKGAGDALGDATAGAAAATAANAAADALGFPADVAIFYAVDQDLAPSQVVPYFTGIQSVKGRPVGIYGSARICDWAATYGIPYRWQTAAWSGGVVSPAACLLQARFLANVDENDVISPWPAWGPKGNTIVTTTFRGVTVDNRTAAMLAAVDALLPTIPFYPSQGSYNTSVAASGGTHAGGGAADIALYVDSRDLTDDEARAIETAARRVGFAAWYRTAIPGVWPRHVHLIAIGCGDLSSAAAQQVVDYQKGRDGLLPRNSAGLSINPDTGDRSYVGVTWETYTPPPPPPQEDDMYTDADRSRDNDTHARVRGPQPTIDAFDELRMGLNSANQAITRIESLLKRLASSTPDAP